MDYQSDDNKKRVGMIVGIVAAVVVATIIVVLFAIFVNRVFGERAVKPTESVSPTVTPTATPEPWDANGVPEIKHIVPTAEILTLAFDKVKGAGSYEINIRSEAGEWQQIMSADTECRIPINSGFTYHVKVRSVSRTGEFGPFSGEAVVSAEAVNPVIKVNMKNDTSITFSWPLTREGASYVFSYKPSDEAEWSDIESDKAEITIGGLMKGKDYDFQVAAVKEDFATLRSEVLTEQSGGQDYGDPFLNAYGILRVGGETKSVPYTAENGCLGINCWAQYKSILYSDVVLDRIICELPGGTPMVITPDEEGRYVSGQLNNKYSVHVTATINGEQKEGWTLANRLFVDLAMIFPQTNQYSIHYNRTNAYSSLFTCGGSAKKVDLKSKEETRYSPLQAKDGPESLKVDGFNEIKDITGKALTNYGPKEQMPAVWDMALQLLIAQRNALANGRCLLIYEAYRPNATSKKVYSAMTSLGYFRQEVYAKSGELVDPENKKDEATRTLANGFLNKNYTEAYFIANNSNHNRGVALDLTLMAYTSTETLGEEVEMQTKMHTLDYRCDMTYNNSEAKLLSTIMTKNTGLVPLRAKQEWWHFELNGDIAVFPCIKEYVYANYQI